MMPMETRAKSEVGSRNAEVACAGVDTLEASPLYLIREFDRELDYAMVRDWWVGHGQRALHPQVLPALGIVVYEADGEPRDLAALWLYLDNSVGVCFLHLVVTVPGLSLKVAKAALFTGIEFLKQRAAAMDYGVMLMTTYPAIARLVKKIGFESDDRPSVSLMTLTKEIPCQ